MGRLTPEQEVLEAELFASPLIYDPNAPICTCGCNEFVSTFELFPMRFRATCKGCGDVVECHLQLPPKRPPPKPPSDPTSYPWSPFG